MNIFYRKYQDQDKKIVQEYAIELCKYVAQFNPLRRESPQADFAETYIEEMNQYIQKRQGAIYVATDDDLVVGFCSGYVKDRSKRDLLEFLSKKRGFIADLYVRPDYQNKGIGSSLLKQTEDYLKGIGYEVILIDLMSQNIKAHTLYNKLGFIDNKIEVHKYL